MRGFHLLDLVARFKRLNAARSLPRPLIDTASYFQDDLQQRDRLIEWLRVQEACDVASIQRALLSAANNGTTFGTALLLLGLLPDSKLAEGYSSVLGRPIASANRYPATPILPELLKPSFLRTRSICPVAIEDGCLVVVSAEPLRKSDISAAAIASGLPVSLEIAVLKDLEQVFDRLYGEVGQPGVSVNEVNGYSEQDRERMEDATIPAPVLRLVARIIEEAVEISASDVHFIPCETSMQVFYRIDGTLREVANLPGEYKRAAVARLKVLGELDIAERRLPQDGRASLPIRGTTIDFRISTFPVIWGEKAVVRVLDRRKSASSLSALGLPGPRLHAWTTMLNQPNGLVLVTGPTGSGKTTTLYASLSHLVGTGRNICTIEDPVECYIQGVTQTQVKPQIGFDFPRALRGLVRQDPDVILVGEIRDLETATIAAQAALTGHLVLSTLHTNTAAGAITRLRNMGTENYLIAACLKGVLAQRLVKQICRSCNEAVMEDAQGLRHGSTRRRILNRETYLQSQACRSCEGTRLSGRVPVTELLSLSDELPDLIATGRSEKEITEASRAAGSFLPFSEHASSLVETGITTYSELIKVLPTQISVSRIAPDIDEFRAERIAS